MMRKSTKNLNWLDHLFECTFNLAYMFNMSPFRIRFDEHQGLFYVSGTPFRKFICIIPTLVIAIFAIIGISSTFSLMSIRNPAMMFIVAQVVGDASLCLLFSYVIWFRQEEIATLFSLTSIRISEKCKEGKVDSNIVNRGKTLAFIACILFVIIVWSIHMFQIVSSTTAFLARSSLSWDSYFGWNYQQLCAGLFIEQKILTIGEMNVFQLVLGFINVAQALVYKVFIAFGILLCLVGVVVVFKKTSEFTNFLKGETDQLTFMRELQSFKEEVESVNGVIGPLMFGIAIVAAPPYFVANFARVVTTWDITTLWIILTWNIYFGILWAAAEVSYRSAEICNWILANGKGQYEEDLFAIFVELTHSPIGLQGMECLTVTYRYMAQMFSAVVSFVIILLQFASAPGEGWVLD